LRLKELGIKILRTKGLGRLPAKSNQHSVKYSIARDSDPVLAGTPRLASRNVGTKTKTNPEKQKEPPEWAALIVCIYIQDSKSEGVDVAWVEELYLVENEEVGSKTADAGS
jgi:hypothetical protein